MTQPASPSTSFFRYVIIGLLVWGLFVGLGAYLGPQFWSQNAPPQNAPSQNTPAQNTTAPATNQNATASTARALNRSFDYRKPLVVVASVGLFVAIWGALLYSRQRRLARDGKIVS